MTALAVHPVRVREPAVADHAPRYRPELDGVRAMAVLLVIAFHADMASMLGGFIGVDIFFVLSGFLVTGLLVDGATTSASALVRFYGRRVRRLLPPALLVLLATAAAWASVATSVEREPVIGDVRSAALYLSNWHFAAQATDYFASTDAPSPVLHFWSLSAEEQFYVAWPALVVVVFALCGRDPRRGRRALSWLAVLLGAASLASLALATRDGSPRAYFGTDARAYQLLAGALLALWAQRRRATGHRCRWYVTGARVAWATQVLAFAGLVVVASSAFDLSPTRRGMLAVALTVALLWAFELVPRGLAGCLLSASIPAYLGRVSYGTYLWHWPVILLIRKFVVMPPYLMFGVATVISGGVASMSYHVLEQPIRLSPALAARSRLVIAGGLAASLAAGVALPQLLASDRHPTITPVAAGQAAPGVLDGPSIPGDRAASGGPVSTRPPAGPSSPPPAEPPPETNTPVPSGAALRDAGEPHPTRTCLEQIVRLGCLAHRGAGPRVLFIGDSHMEAFFPVLDDLALEHDLNLYTWMYYLCPWQKDVSAHRGQCRSVPREQGPAL